MINRKRLLSMQAKRTRLRLGDARLSAGLCWRIGFPIDHPVWLS